MCNVMEFPDTVDEFIEQYGERDTEEVYTNGSMLIPVFRVKQMLDHYFRERTCHWELEHSGTRYDKWRCSKCGYQFVESRCDHGYTGLEPNYCPNCGSKVMEQ